MRARLVLVLGAFVAAWLPATALAQAGGSGLRYAAPAGCPDEAAFRAELAARTARGPEGNPAAPSFDVSIAASEPAFGRLAIRGADGTEMVREVHGATCSEVVSALAVITALVLDGRAAPGPEAAAPVATTAAAPPPAAAPVVTGPVVAPSPPPPGPPPDRTSPPDRAFPAGRFAAGAHGAIVTGTGPSARLGPRVIGELGLGGPGDPAPALRLSFLWTPPFTDATSAGTATLTFWTLRAEGCPLAFGGGNPVHLVLCAAFEAGRIAGEGTDTIRGASDGRLWLAPGALARAGVSLGPVDLELEGGAVVPIYKYRFLFVPSPVVYEVADVSAAGGIGAVVRFP